MVITPLLVIFLVFVFILLFLFLKTVDHRKWLTISISLILTPFAYFYLFYPFVNILSNYHHQKYFDSDAWKEDPKLRYEMIDQIIASDTLIGTSKENLTGMLGKAEWLSWDETNKQKDTNRWNYGLGIEPGAFNNERDCVEIIFKNNEVDSLIPFKEEIKFENEEK